MHFSSVILSEVDGMRARPVTQSKAPKPPSYFRAYLSPLLK